MKLFSEKLLNLPELYEKQLRLLLSAEEEAAIKLALLADSATDPDLHQALLEHKQETNSHAATLKEILARVAGRADPLKCKVTSAMSDETEERPSGVSQEAVRRALLIAAAQRIEHFEIAIYGGARQFARVLGCDNDPSST